MNLLAITCWTGDEAMAAMTHRMLVGLDEALHSAASDYLISVHGQGTEERIPAVPHGRTKFSYSTKNQGFAFGMNQALGMGLMDELPDTVLCINNDIEFPDPHWFQNLIGYGYLDKHVGVPTTNFTACKEQEAESAMDCESFDVPATPAVCWYLPWKACKILFKYSGGMGKLFREDIGRAWGEDGFAAAALQKDLDPNPFRIVPRSFVKHLGERTSSLVPAKEKMRSYHKSQELIRSVLGD